MLCVKLPPSFCFQLEGTTPFDRLVALCAQHTLATVLIDLSLHLEVQPADKAKDFKTLASVHCAVVQVPAILAVSSPSDPVTHTYEQAIQSKLGGPNKISCW